MFITVYQAKKKSYLRIKSRYQNFCGDIAEKTTKIVYKYEPTIKDFSQGKAVDMYKYIAVPMLMPYSANL